MLDTVVPPLIEMVLPHLKSNYTWSTFAVLSRVDSSSVSRSHSDDLDRTSATLSRKSRWQLSCM